MAIMVVGPEEPARVGLRRLPRLCRQALSICWTAGRGDLIVVTALGVAGAVGLAGLLLIGQHALNALLKAVAEHAPLTAVAPWALAIAGLAALQSLAGAVRRERQQVLGERVSRYVQGRILDLTAAVDLAMFDAPDFHNRVQRSQMGVHQPLNMVQGLFGLVQSAFGVVAGLVAVVAVAPQLLPLLLLVLVPAWLGASKRGDAFHRFFWKMTHQDRQRHYLSSLLQSRESAKEVRAFGLGGHLRRRYEQLYDERMAELGRLARQQTRWSLLVNVATGVVLSGTLLLVAWLTLTGTVPLASATIAVAGVAVVGERLAGLGWSAGALTESAGYLDDYLAFNALLPEVRRSRPTGSAR